MAHSFWVICQNILRTFVELCMETPHWWTEPVMHCENSQVQIAVFLKSNMLQGWKLVHRKDLFSIYLQLVQIIIRNLMWKPSINEKGVIWPRGYTPGNSSWVSAIQFSKSWIYFRPKMSFLTPVLHTWPLKSIPIFRPGL